MSKHVSVSDTEKVKLLMFGESTGNQVEQFLQNELIRYIPQLIGKTDEEIADFVSYQKEIYIDGAIPVMGRPIASLNPTFSDSIDSIHFSSSLKTYTRASVKENGYRMQIHVGVDKTSAFTRQFTRFDLRMFPELSNTFANLPVMIGDAELINKRFEHLAGFNRVQLRIPNQQYWPKPGELGLDEDFLKKYLSNMNLFSNGIPIQDTELTIAFHGVFAIARPETWDSPREVQMKNIVSLSKLPIDYMNVDEILDKLAEFVEKKSLNARVVEKCVVKNPKQLKSFVDKNFAKKYEGTCIVQSVWDKDESMLVNPRAVKIKAYETLDCALLGLYLKDRVGGLKEENIIGALVGLYDEFHGIYLPATKVNLDPEGVQIKTPGQKERLTKLRAEIASQATLRFVKGNEVFTLYNMYLLEGKVFLTRLFGEINSTYINLEYFNFFKNLPQRADLLSLWDTFEKKKGGFCSKAVKRNTIANDFVYKYLSFFQMIEKLNKEEKRRFFKYFSKIKAIKATSAKLTQPDIVLDVSKPIILETLVFDIKWGSSPFAAGFHSWYANSFCLKNCFVERIRHDKSTTTEYSVIYALARKYTPK